METRDLDEVREINSRRYVENRPRLVDGASEFLFRSRAAWAGGLSVDRSLCRAVMSVSSDPLRNVLVVGVFGGRLEATAGRRQERVGVGESLMLLQHTSIEVRMDRMTYRAVQLPGDVPARIAGRLGVAGADFRFERMTPVSGAANRRWVATVSYLDRLLGDAGPAGIPSLLLNAAIDTAASACLTVFPNTTMAVAYLPGPGRAAPAAVRRAVSYIDTHAAEPITLDDIAAAAGVGARAVQMAFRRHLDTTPVSYLRRVRLERAHRDLQAADPTTGVTVAAIARRWGFAAPGRFAGHYKAAYGHAPSRTLQA